MFLDWIFICFTGSPAFHVFQNEYKSTFSRPWCQVNGTINVLPRRSGIVGESTLQPQIRVCMYLEVGKPSILDAF